LTHLLDLRGSCRVLVVDDDRDAADSLVQMLRLWGFSAQAVYDGAQAVLAEEALKPSLVLLDIEMPQLDGYTAATVIRRGWPERRVRLVALTGRSSPVHVELSASVGFDEHICKPIGRAKLHMLALNSGPPESVPR
jgi:two-component system, sensor histidine kinase